MCHMIHLRELDLKNNLLSVLPGTYVVMVTSNHVPVCDLVVMCSVKTDYFIFLLA